MKRNIVIATVAAAALIGGGTATALAVSDDDEAPAQRSSVQTRDDDRDDGDDGRDGRDDRDDDAAGAGAAKVTAADAIDAALKHTSGTAVGAELDSEGRDLVWDVDVLSSGTTWHSVLVDPGTGKVLDSRTETGDDDADDAAEARAALKGTSVSAAEAAQAAAGKGVVTSVDLDDDGRSHAWRIETTGADGAESEWDVDLKTSKVTADRADDDTDDDASDDHSDDSDD
ncbi:hypothetical protein GCM10010145_09630 [Streptomyces ruber]|uniref:PepSY domain-containing protein n=2 Tax=Streptomyces TaxID=1883 RepID=A0A918B8G1_9ACTN|nr:PepSY domain-containing protein [Streptomyces ruber]GGQ42707.1 hypothetical protein GCM10010145_09630 [Streptomyces ruber]